MATLHHKHLGVTLDSKLDWSHHFQNLEKRASSVVGILYGHLPHISRECRKTFYHTYVLPIFLYCCVVWCGAGNGLFAKLEIVHRRILRAILRLPPETNIAVLYENCCTFPLKHYIDRSSSPAYTFTKSNLSLPLSMCSIP